jgi:phage terminase large subunit-like protein
LRPRSPDEEELAGRRCFAGLDLGRVNDLSSLALVFPPQEAGEAVKIIWRHWCPQEDILRRSRRDRAPYPLWRDQGLLIATEGNTTDFKFIEAEILELAARFVATELAYDRTFAGEIVRNLQDEGLSLVEFGQGFLSMGPPQRNSCAF